MDFERRLATRNVTFTEPQEITPKGIIVYSSGFPIYRKFQRKVYNRTGYRASVHALIDEDGVTQILPLNLKGWHSGTTAGNTEYLSVMVCEPNPERKNYLALRDSTRNNLVQYLVFLCRYWAIEPVNVCNVIQFAGTASRNYLVASEVLKPCVDRQAYFGKVTADPSTDDKAYCNENSIYTEVKQTLGQLAKLYGETPHIIETPLTQMGIGDVVLFTGGGLFNSCGSSTRQTFTKEMCYGIITDENINARHPFQVMFLSGSTAWVNKSSLVRSTLGHINL